MLAALLVMMFVLSLYAGRLFQLQGLDASVLAQEALGERLRTVTLTAARGDVLDRDGVVMATTAERRDVTVDQTVVGEYRQQVDGESVRVGVAGAARALAPVLGVDVMTLRQRLTGDEQFAYVSQDVAPEVWRQVDELDIPGVYGAQASRRVYPSGSVGANVIGFVGTDGPLAGLEMSMDDVLSGVDGSRRYERGLRGQIIPTGEREEVAPVPGQDVTLTIDRDLQWRAQEAIASAVAATAAESGSIVAIQPETGEILALAAAPTFDPNDVGGVSDGELRNRALSDVFEPGSTSKVISVSAALEEGVVEPTTGFEVPDRIVRGSEDYKDSHSHAVERLTVAGVVAQSSNVGTIMTGERVTPERMHDYMVAFGLGQPSGLGFPGESSGLLADPDTWSGSQRYTVLFGQGLSTTALQAAQVYATIANDGVQMPPSLVAGTGSGAAYEPTGAGEGRRVVSEKTALIMRDMLEAVVGEEGTGEEATVAGYRVAGKTGTAERYDDACRCYAGYTGSFVGMAPADDPKVVVSVTIQNPTNGFYGGTIAGPVFADVMTYALAELGVEPTQTAPTPFPLTW